MARTTSNGGGYKGKAAPTKVQPKVNPTVSKKTYKKPGPAWMAPTPKSTSNVAANLTGANNVKPTQLVKLTGEANARGVNQGPAIPANAPTWMKEEYAQYNSPQSQARAQSEVQAAKSGNKAQASPAATYQQYNNQASQQQAAQQIQSQKARDAALVSAILSFTRTPPRSGPFSTNTPNQYTTQVIPGRGTDDRQSVPMLNDYNNGYPPEGGGPIGGNAGSGLSGGRGNMIPWNGRMVDARTIDWSALGFNFDPTMDGGGGGGGGSVFNTGGGWSGGGSDYSSRPDWWAALQGLGNWNIR